MSVLTKLVHIVTVAAVAAGTFTISGTGSSPPTVTTASATNATSTASAGKSSPATIQDTLSAAGPATAATRATEPVLPAEAASFLDTPSAARDGHRTVRQNGAADEDKMSKAEAASVKGINRCGPRYTNVSTALQIRLGGSGGKVLTRYRFRQIPSTKRVCLEFLLSNKKYVITSRRIEFLDTRNGDPEQLVYGKHSKWKSYNRRFWSYVLLVAYPKGHPKKWNIYPRLIDTTT